VVTGDQTCQLLLQLQDHAFQLPLLALVLRRRLLQLERVAQAALP